MISYYNSKHPGLFIYITLLIISVSSLLFLNNSNELIGFLSILWGIFIFMRILSLYEVSEHFSVFTKKSYSKISNKNISTLAHDLLKNMNGEEYIKRGLLAMHSIEKRTLLWFIISITYVTIYSQNIDIPQQSNNNIILIKNFSIFFIIGAVFWAGQTYTYSNHASKLLFATLAPLFIMSIHNVINDISINNIDIPNNISSIILSSLIIYCLVSIFQSAIKGWEYILNAIAGTLILFTMSIIAISVETSNNIELSPIWISGWGLFSIFWIRSYQYRQKKYIIYQCE